MGLQQYGVRVFGDKVGHANKFGQVTWHETPVGRMEATFFNAQKEGEFLRGTRLRGLASKEELRLQGGHQDMASKRKKGCGGKRGGK